MPKCEAVQVFIIKDNKILLLKRKKEPYKNCWCPPGGKVDEGETPEEAAYRETQEEANIICTHLHFDRKLINPETSTVNYFFTTSTFSGNINNNEPKKHETLLWFSLDNLPEEKNWGLRKWFDFRNIKNTL